MILPLHGVQGPTDLPIPFSYAVVGASWALTISFAVLALAWKQPKFAKGPVDEPARRRLVLAVLGALVTAWILGVLFFGPEDDNAGVPAVYVLVWVGLVPLALVAGHVWRHLSLVRSVQALVGRATGRPDGWLTYPSRWGYWPAAIGLYSFVWLELASPNPGSVEAVRLWVALYLAVTLLGGIVFGPTWFDRADPFDVFSALVAKLSPFVTNDRWDLHNPLRTLPTIGVQPGLIAVIAVLLGSTAFDSFSASATWAKLDPNVLIDSLGLLCFAAVVAGLFSAAAMATGGVSRERRRVLPGLLAHSLVPIVVGYFLAHYLSLLVEEGQRTVFALSSRSGEAQVATVLSDNPAMLAILKIGFVLAGHVVAVVAAHDKALALLPRAHRLSGQLAMLVLMVIYTFTGLYLLFTI